MAGLHMLGAVGSTQIAVAFHFGYVGLLFAIVGKNAVVFKLGNAFCGWGCVQVVAEAVDK